MVRETSSDFPRSFSRKSRRISASERTDSKSCHHWLRGRSTSGVLSLGRGASFLSARVATSIKSPILRCDPCQHRGPTWDDVIRLLNGTVGTNASDIRAQALLQLFAFYGIRASEAVRLRLDDIDWNDKTLLIRRSKRGGRHHFLLHHSVAEAIRRYIEKARPKCSCPNVFVTLNGPYRPLIQPTVSAVVHSRMVKLGVSSLRFGPQALRHSCATQLLKLGASPAEIADFLGHRNTRTVQVYAKSDSDALRQVSNLDLIGAL
jgi:integrase/recombinase XerD